MPGRPEAAAEAQRIEERPDIDQLRSRLEDYPNATGTAIGYPQKDGQFKRDTACLVVYVDEKVPESELAPDERIPPQVSGVPVDVRQANPQESDNEYNQRSDTQVSSRIRPFVGGLRLSRQSGSYGTITLGVQDSTGTKCALVNNHIVHSGSDCGNDDTVGVGNAMYQPEEDTSESDNNQLGVVSEVSGATGSSGDWALVDIDDDAHFTNEVMGAGVPGSEQEPAVGDRIVMTGAKTGLVGAEVVSTSASADINGCTYTNLIEYEQDQRPDSSGNSGALAGIVDSDGTFHPSGMHSFSSNETQPVTAWAQDIADVRTESGFQYDGGSYTVSGDGSAAYFQATISSVDSTNREVDVYVLNAGGSQATKTVELKAGRGGEVIHSHTTTLDPFDGEVFTASLVDNYEMYTVETPDTKWVSDLGIGKTLPGDAWTLAQTLTDGTGFCLDARFSPDGSLLAKASDDSNVYIYDTSDWSLVQTLTDRDSNDRAYCVEWSPDGSQLAAGGAITSGNSDPVYIYDTSTWNVTQTITYSANTAYGLAWSPGGGLLAIASSPSSSGDDGYVWVYDTSDWSLAQQVGSDTDSGKRDADFSPDGDYLAITKVAAPRYEVYRTSDWGLEGSSDVGVANDSRAVSFSPDSGLLTFTEDVSGTVHAVEETDWGVIREDQQDATDDSHGIRFSPNGAYLAWGSEDNNVYIEEVPEVILSDANWSEITDSPLTDSTDQAGGFPQGVDWDGANGYLAVASYDGNVYVYNAPVTVDAAAAQTAGADTASAASSAVDPAVNPGGVTAAADVASAQASAIDPTAASGVHTAAADVASVQAAAPDPDFVGPNLLTNPGFEHDPVGTTDPTGWTSVNGVYAVDDNPDSYGGVSTGVYEGSVMFGSGWQDGPGAAGTTPDARVYQDVDVEGPATILVRAVVLLQEALDDNWTGPQSNAQYVYEDDARLHLIYYDSSDTQIGEDYTRTCGDAFNRGLDYITELPAGSGDRLFEIEETFDLPSDTARVRLEIQAGDGNDDYIDEPLTSNWGGNAGLFMDAMYLARTVPASAQPATATASSVDPSATPGPVSVPAAPASALSSALVASADIGERTIKPDAAAAAADAVGPAAVPGGVTALAGPAAAQADSQAVSPAVEAGGVTASVDAASVGVAAPGVRASIDRKSRVGRNQVELLIHAYNQTKLLTDNPNQVEEL